MQISDQKPWYLSKGFVGPLVTAILMLFRGLGVIDLDDQSTLTVVYQVIEFAGVALGAYGRATATKTIRAAL
ncbi:MAG: hypothetical protein H6905_05525 [Hyphomicrobiales bacterium]|nr:hypothetical protein [Hyphomicrobiales bacterium]